MTLPNVDNTTLNNLTPNLDIGDVADPALRLAAFNYIYAEMQAIVTDGNAAQAAGAITTLKLADGSVVTAKLADGAVTGAKMADGTIVTIKLADGSITTAKIVAGAVGTTQLADLSVTQAKIANGAVGPYQLATGLAATVDVNAQFAKRGIDVTSAPYSAVGDGVTDCTAAIQAAFNAAQDGGMVFFPAGTYKAGAITINKKIRVFGEGTLLYNFNTATGGMLIVNVDDVTIEGLRFDAFGTVGAFAYKAYIYSTKKRTIISDCKFVNGMQGAMFDNGSTFGKILNCHAENMAASGILFLQSLYGEAIGNTLISCGDGALSSYSSRQISFVGNQIYTCDQGITVDGGSRYVTVSGNKVWGDVTGTTAASGFAGIEVKDSSHYCVVSNNVVTGLVRGIALWRGEAGVECSNNVAIGNNISDIITKNSSVPYGMYIDGQDGCVIEGNNLSRINGTYMAVDNYNNSDADVIIANNNFNLHGKLFGTIPYKAYNQTALNVVGLSQVTIEGNNFNCAPEVMTVSLIIINNVSNFLVNGNNVRNMTNTVFDIQGSSQGVLSNNLIVRGNTGGFVFLLSTTGRIDIRDNVQKVAGGYFIVGGTTPYIAEGNVFASTFSDGMNGSAIIRLFNNENTSTGMNGGQMRFSGGKVQVWDGSAWVTVGTQT